MLKEKWNKTKSFVKEHKKEIVTGVILISGAVLAYVVNENSKSDTKVESVSDEERYMNAYNKAATIANETLIPEINKKYEQYDFSNVDNDPEMKKIYDQYLNECDEKFEQLLESQF